MLRTNENAAKISLRQGDKLCRSTLILSQPMQFRTLTDLMAFDIGITLDANMTNITTSIQSARQSET